MSGFSISLGGKKPLTNATKAAPVKALGKRPRAAFLDDGVAGDEQPVHQEISGFNADGGAVHVQKSGGAGAPLVIKVAPNPKRQKSSLPSNPTQTQRTSKEEEVKAAKAAATAEIIYGLNRPKPKEDTVEERPSTSVKESAEPIKEKTDDERALEALIEGKGPDSNHVIPAAVNEDEAYSRDFEDAPDVPTQADYDAVPIEQFGAALLRGMGWKDGQGIGSGAAKSDSKIKVAERRPAMLGVGAAPKAALGIEIGAWGKQDSKGKKTESAYNPVILKNKVTGETITQDELKLKLAEQAKNDLVFERSGVKRSKSERDGEEKEDKGPRRDRGSERDYDDRKRSSRRERSASYEDRRRERSLSSDRDRRDRKDKRRDRSRDDKDRRHRERSRDGRRCDDHESKSDRDHRRDKEIRRERESSRDRRRRHDDERARDKHRERDSDRRRDKERDRRR